MVTMKSIKIKKKFGIDFLICCIAKQVIFWYNLWHIERRLQLVNSYEEC